MGELGVAEARCIAAVSLGIGVSWMGWRLIAMGTGRTV
ncbi:hypothetical protein [Azospirillum endophyticum]